MISSVSVWLIVALLILMLEFTTATFYLLAVSAACAVAAVVAYFGGSISLQWLFASFCGLFFLGIAYKFRRSMNKTQNMVDFDLGQKVSLIKDDHTRVHYRGTQWGVVWEDVDHQAKHLTILSKQANNLVVGRFLDREGS
jgi:membrane protein implicated in regulation of membrane protease activity